MNAKKILHKLYFLNYIRNIIEKCYTGLFGCAGDRVPLGAPALMMSPQGVNMGTIKPELVQKRDEKYNTSTENLKMSRIDIPVPEKTVQNPNYADYWMHSYKGFAIDVQQTEMKKIAPFP